jgi:MFS transporter, DHA2 family, multidrug resistance protein
VLESSPARDPLAPLSGTAGGKAVAVPVPQADPSWLKWAILISASLGALLEIVDTSIVNVALDEMRANLGATLSDIGWVVTIYSIANVIILPMSAWLGDRFGTKRYFIFSLVSFTAASVLCGLSSNLGMLIFARLLQGLGGGGLLAKAQAILFKTFPRNLQAAAQAIFGMVVIAGPAVGPVLGGYIVTNMNWRWIFFINLPVGIIATVMCWAFLKEEAPTQQARESKVDWLGIGLLVVAVGSLQTFLEQGQQDDWFNSPFISTLGVTATLGLILLVWRELTTEHPVIDFRILRYRSLAAGSVMSMVLGMGLYGALFAIPIFAQSILGFTAQQTGLLLAPSAVVAIFTFPLVGQFIGKVDARALIVLGAILIIGSMFSLQSLSPLSGTDSLFWPLIVRGIGTSFMFLPITLATMGPIPKQDVSAASGFFNLTRQLGGSIGIAALTTLLQDRNAFHRNVIVEKLQESSASAAGRVSQLAAGFVSKGYDAATAHQMGRGLLDAIVNRQASVLSFGDIFHVVGLAFLATLPLVFLLGSGKGARLGGAH